MTPKEKHLMEQISKMKKENRDLLSALKQKFETSIENFCKSKGGHFFGDSYIGEDPRVLDPYRQSVFKQCVVCHKRVVVKEDVQK